MTTNNNEELLLSDEELENGKEEDNQPEESLPQPKNLNIENEIERLRTVHNRKVFTHISSYPCYTTM